MNALVHGGRNINETELIPSYKKEWILDVDLKSCYGTALLNYELPIGIPEVYALANETLAVTLKEFLDQNNFEIEGSL